MGNTDVLKELIQHKGFSLLLAAASGVVIFGLYPTVGGLIMAYAPRVYVANVQTAAQQIQGDFQQVVSGGENFEVPEQI